MKKIVFSIAVVAVLTLAFLHYSLHPEVLRYEVKSDDENREIHAIFYDSGSVRVATASLINRGYDGNIASFRFVLWHRENSKVEHLKITISPNVGADIYLKTPDGYPWNPIRLQRSKDDPASVTLEVPDMGFQGEGTITLDFIVVTYKKFDALSITAETEFELSEGFKRYAGRSVSTLSMPSYSEVVGAG
jgi:hypothetical protein